MVRQNLLRPWLPQVTINQLLVIVSLAPLLILASCRQALVEKATPNNVLAPSPTPPEMPIVTPTLAPQPTATLPPSPTATPEPEPTACPDPYFFLPSPPSCPAGEPLASFAAEQAFEAGVMIWFEATDSIYIFYKAGHWQRFDDSWSEDQIQSDPAFIPPADRFQPIRGFGKVWRENLNVREQLGWALGVELAFDSMMQEQATEIDALGVLFLSTFNGQVFALTTLEQDEGDWVIAAS